MAYASWVTPNKVSGNGNDTVSWTGQPHTGRTARSTTATFAASGVESKTLTINQAGKTEFVSMDDTAAVSKSGGTVTITGTSNSSKLTFTLTGTNGIGDPGAAQQYSVSITFTGIGENTSIEALTSQLTVTDNAGNTDTCTITQAAGDAYLTISPTTINLTAAGTAVSVNVSSNTSWTIA